MTAKEMFEEYGFKEVKDPCLLVNSEVAYEIKFDENNKLVVAFNKVFTLCGVHLEHWYNGEMCEVVITPKLFKAINKQLEELGWLESKVEIVTEVEEVEKEIKFPPFHEVKSKSCIDKALASMREDLDLIETLVCKYTSKEDISTFEKLAIRRLFNNSKERIMYIANDIFTETYHYIEEELGV